MAERQYIGARYVPVFYDNPNTHDSTWLSGVAYEPLTIVVYGTNTYTSKKLVPAGIGNPSANPDYWVATGIFNAQVDELRQDVEDMQETIDEMLPITPENTEAKKYILIADSFGNPDTIGGFTWQDYFADIVGAGNVYKGYTSSGGFVHAGSNGTYLALITSMRANIDDPNLITDIVVETAGNDASETATDIVNALAAFKAYCKTNFPYAKIHIGVTSKTETESEDVHYAVVEKILPTLKDHQYIGYHYMTNMEYVMHNLTTVDGVHPTQASSAYLAGHLYNGVANGGTSVFYKWSTACTPLLGGATTKYNTRMSNNITNFTIGGEIPYALVYDNANGESMSYINMDYATLPFTSIWSLIGIATPVLIQITLADNSTINTSAMLRLTYDNTNRVTKLHLETAGLESPIVVKKIHLYKFNITAPTEDML